MSGSLTVCSVGAKISIRRFEVIMLAYLFVVLALAVRFMPHVLNFTPVAASLLYFGARGPRRQLWVPWVLMAASDVILTLRVYNEPLTWDHLVTWAWYAGMLWLGTRLREESRVLAIGGAALAGSVSFFVLSNFAVWAAWNDLYPKTLAGLGTCYAAAVPFFRHTLEGDLLFTALFFGLPVALKALAGQRRPGGHSAAA
jgi:hypothetical protein